jgi:hypothetical protein
VPHTGKIGIQYTDDKGNVMAVLQAADIAGALGNVPAAVNTRRLSEKIKPRRVALRTANGGTSPGGASTFTYAHHVVGAVAFGTINFGDIITDGVATWTVVGFDDEVNNGSTAF